MDFSCDTFKEFCEKNNLTKVEAIRVLERQLEDLNAK